MERIIYKSKPKRLFDLGGGICYIKMRGSIYFLATTKYNSYEILRKACNYDSKTPIEFYGIVHENYLNQQKKIEDTNKKKQVYYKQMRLVRKKAKIKKLRAEIKELQNDM